MFPLIGWDLAQSWLKKKIGRNVVRVSCFRKCLQRLMFSRRSHHGVFCPPLQSPVLRRQAQLSKRSVPQRRLLIQKWRWRNPDSSHWGRWWARNQFFTIFVKIHEHLLLFHRQMVSLELVFTLLAIISWHCHGTCSLTHLPLDKMAAIFLTMFSNAYPWMKTFVFWLKLHWSLFLRVQLTITQDWFR